MTGSFPASILLFEDFNLFVGHTGSALFKLRANGIKLIYFKQYLRAKQTKRAESFVTGPPLNFDWNCT